MASPPAASRGERHLGLHRALVEGDQLPGRLGRGQPLPQRGKVDGKAVWVEKPLGLEGLTLFVRGDRNDGKDEREQRFDADDFAGYADLEPGAAFSGDVRERHDSAKWDWLYQVEVGAPKKIAHPLLGEVEVVPVSEKRSVRRGSYSYSSQCDFLFYPAIPITVSWTYKDDKGVRECELKEYARP